jgi:hypothetical protein
MQAGATRHSTPMRTACALIQESFMQVHRQARLWVLLAAGVAATSAMAQVSGEIGRGEAATAYARAGQPGSSAARTDVRSETLAALRSGQLARGEEQASAPVFASTLSRAEVKAETLATLRLGLVPHGQAAARDATVAEREQIRLAVEDAHNAPTAVASKSRRSLF